MEIEVVKKVKIKIETLNVKAKVRYWEDATVDGVEDEEGALIPCRNGRTWEPVIKLETGQILNWEKGKTANIHYKICDEGIYELVNEFGVIEMVKDGYVPDIMCPKDSGYGDYIIMDVDQDGFIKNWVVDLSDFINHD